jgi:hypothetical protein
MADCLQGGLWPFDLDNLIGKPFERRVRLIGDSAPQLFRMAPKSALFASGVRLSSAIASCLPPMPELLNEGQANCNAAATTLCVSSRASGA